MSTSILVVSITILCLNAVVIIAKLYKGQEHQEKKAQLKEYCNGHFGIKEYKIYHMHVNDNKMTNALVYTCHTRWFMREECKWYLIKENQGGYIMEVVEQLH